MSDTAVFSWRPGLDARGARDAFRRMVGYRRNSTPSIRIPVTPSNREYLRALRARELELWSETDGTHGADVEGAASKRLDPEGRVIVALLAVATTGLLVQAVPLSPVLSTWASRIFAWIEGLL